ncbi:S26 family signal peptidase [uncultured Caulobacter sp.]|uniref:S26 family signal peptidase n=1 Tax=uncultured Caulobacter sp. TaxID=158749 RepID=UPI00262BD98C|nr:S26 family signal peptidase [uncultured Caulobacter sp.]
MSRRARLLAAAVVGCVLTIAPAVMPVTRRLIFNTTASVPVGLYWLEERWPGAGGLALVRPPPRLGRWMAERHYLPLNVPLIKRIAATEGQVVCVQHDLVRIDGAVVAQVLNHDRLGRRLVPAPLCRRLAADEVFLLNPERRSLDGRYFGTLSRRCVVGRLTPLWTWAR